MKLATAFFPRNPRMDVRQFCGIAYNVLVSPTPPRLTGVERVLDNSYLRLGKADLVSLGGCVD